MVKKISNKTKKIVSNKLSPDWKLNDSGTQLSMTKKFTSFLQGFMFVTRVSINSEVLMVYPEITLTKLTVKISINASTGISSTDLELAMRIDSTMLSPKNN